MRREFRQLKRAWYGKVCLAADTIIDNITIGLYDEDESCEFEFSINWIDLGKIPTVQLCMFYDSWIAFEEFKDLFSKLSVIDSNTTPEEIVNILLECNFVDATKEVRND